MQIKSYDVAMNSTYDLASVKRSGSAYENLNSSRKDTQTHSLEDNGEAKTLTKTREKELKTDVSKTDALTGKLAAGLLKRISDVVSGRSQNGSLNKNDELTTKDQNFQNPTISTHLNIEQNSNVLYNSTGKRYVGADAVSALRTFESEEMSLSIKAQVQTTDKNIEVNLNVNLKRSFVELSNFTRAELELSDPLVISLNGQMPSLSDEKFEFDIDSDGTMWQISKLRDGSGFLALDKNENGAIDDGSELFGTKSGNGFSDLAEFDDDGNGWIDKNDSIFNKLRIWQKTDTEDKLIVLGESGIGAIFLGNVNSEFSIGLDNKLGQLRNTGFFLKDIGEAGLITQIDLVKSKDKKPEPNDTQTRIEKFIKHIDELSENLRKNIPQVPKKQIEIKTVNPLEIELRESKKALQTRLKYLKSRLAKESVINQKSIKSHIMLLESRLSDIEAQSAFKF